MKTRLDSEPAPHPQPLAGRRSFIQGALSLAALPLVACGAQTSNGPPPSAAATTEQPLPASAEPGRTPPVVYLCFTPDEAVFVEAMVNVMCPADELTPSGVDCGIAFFIDRQLAGAFGRGERSYQRGPWRRSKPELGYQLPLTPAQFFSAGLAAVEGHVARLQGKSFAELEPAEADKFLQSLANGDVKDSRLPLASWFNGLIYPLFVAGCFGDPIYGGNRDKVFWKMIGYPGLPAFYANDIVTFRGKPYPGALAPKSISDFG